MKVFYRFGSPTLREVSLIVFQTSGLEISPLRQPLSERTQHRKGLRAYMSWLREACTILSSDSESTKRLGSYDNFTNVCKHLHKLLARYEVSLISIPQKYTRRPYLGHPLSERMKHCNGLRAYVSWLREDSSTILSSDSESTKNFGFLWQHH